MPRVRLINMLPFLLERLIKPSARFGNSEIARELLCMRDCDSQIQFFSPSNREVQS
jgi:hypothetical protein